LWFQRSPILSGKVTRCGRKDTGFVRAYEVDRLSALTRSPKLSLRSQELFDSGPSQAPQGSASGLPDARSQELYFCGQGLDTEPLMEQGHQDCPFWNNNRPAETWIDLYTGNKVISIVCAVTGVGAKVTRFVRSGPLTVWQGHQNCASFPQITGRRHIAQQSPRELSTRWRPFFASCRR